MRLTCLVLLVYNNGVFVRLRVVVCVGTGKLNSQITFSLWSSLGNQLQKMRFVVFPFFALYFFLGFSLKYLLKTGSLSCPTQNEQTHD